MSDERRADVGAGDFVGEDEVREEKSEEEMEEDYESELSGENEEIDGGEIGEERESDSAKNDDEKAPDKRIKAAPIDRLSALPDAILVHTLSFLRSVEKAAITSVLSKRWQYLWTDLPDLTFTEESEDIEKTREFVTRVHRALIHRTEKYLENFVIRFEYDESFASAVNVWVEFVARNKVKKFSLLLSSSSDFYLVPQALYSCSSLTMLCLECCLLSPQRAVDWHNLTELSVEDVELHDHVIQKILSGCPVLHSLDLSSCWGYRCLEIESQSLQELFIIEPEDKYTETLLEISAPYLECLEVKNFPIDRKNLRIKNAPYLGRVFIEFSDEESSVEEMDCLMELLEDIRHVKEFELRRLWIQILSEMVENGWQLPQSTRKSLIIDTTRDQDGISGIVGLLESSPHLETLVVQCIDDYEGSSGIVDPMAEEDLDCDLPHLKTVDITDYGDPNLGGEPMLTLARILLKRATNLEKMVIDGMGNLAEFSPDVSTNMSRALFSYPRSSQIAEVIFQQ